MSKKTVLATQGAAGEVTNSQAQQPVEKRESIWKDVLDGIVSNKAALVSAIFILLLALIAIVTKLVPGILPYDPYEQNLAESVQGPSAAHWFGTDIQGRDIFSRVLVGTQITLVVGLAAVAISLTVGVLLGAIAGYKGGKWDTVIMRIMDMMLAIPSILLAIAIMAALGQGIEKAVVAIGLVAIPEYARIVRSEILAIKENDYVAAARVIGDSNFAIVFRHVLPNALPSIIVRATLGISGARLPRSGRAAARCRMGRHARTRPQRALPRSVAYDFPWSRHHAYCACIQPTRRRYSRRFGSEVEEEVALCCLK